MLTVLINPRLEILRDVTSVNLTSDGTEFRFHILFAGNTTTVPYSSMKTACTTNEKISARSNNLKFPRKTDQKRGVKSRKWRLETAWVLADCVLKQDELQTLLSECSNQHSNLNSSNLDISHCQHKNLLSEHLCAELSKNSSRMKNRNPNSSSENKGLKTRFIPDNSGIPSNFSSPIRRKTQNNKILLKILEESQLMQQLRNVLQSLVKSSISGTKESKDIPVQVELQHSTKNNPDFKNTKYSKQSDILLLPAGDGDCALIRTGDFHLMINTGFNINSNLIKNLLPEIKNNATFPSDSEISVENLVQNNSYEIDALFLTHLGFDTVGLLRKCKNNSNNIRKESFSKNPQRKFSAYQEENHISKECEEFSANLSKQGNIEHSAQHESDAFHQFQSGLCSNNCSLMLQSSFSGITFHHVFANWPFTNGNFNLKNIAEIKDPHMLSTTFQFKQSDKNSKSNLYSEGSVEKSPTKRRTYDLDILNIAPEIFQRFLDFNIPVQHSLLENSLDSQLKFILLYHKIGMGSLLYCLLGPSADTPEWRKFE